MRNKKLSVLLLMLLSALTVAAAEPVSLPAGKYVIGASLPEGTYTISLPAGATITIAGENAKVLGFSGISKLSGFETLSAEFGKLSTEIAGYNDTIALCNEFDELLERLSKENTGMDSGTELNMKLRYYKVKDLLRAIPGGIVTAKDGELEEFKTQVDKLRNIMIALRNEAKAAMTANIKQQSEYYARSLSDEKTASAKMQEALDKRSEIVQAILALDSADPQ